MTQRPLHLVVPGSLEQPTGGYRYGARMVAHLRNLGWGVVVHELQGRFPDPDLDALGSFSETLATIPSGARTVIDGLALGGLPVPVAIEKRRLRLAALVHHPLADETGLSDGERDRFATLEREALSACHGVVVTSEFTAARVTESYGIPAARVRTVRPGTDPVAPADGPPPDAPPTLLCVAAVTPRKGHDVLVRALTRISDLSWTCTCVGSLDRAPEYAASVQNLAHEAGLEGRIRFTGACGDEALQDHYRTSSLFVLPSHYEGYGMAFAEALARGLPVVGTTGGAIPHTVPDDAGKLVPPGDDEALATVLQRLLDDAGSERRAQMAAAALMRSAELPDWDQAAKAFARALAELLPDGTEVDPRA